MKTIVVALGGNALIAKGQKGTASEQLATVANAARGIVNVIKAGHRVVVTHGNGPQVGFMLRAHELAEREVPPLPLDFLDAATQGTIGYMLQQTLQQELAAAGIKKPVGTIITQVLVSRNDVAFSKPSKPIGGFYSHEEAQKLAREKGWNVAEDAGRGWRRVVPSPKPISIVERALVRELVERGVIVIACGGGGIPVVRDSASGGALRGVEAVVDKDFASCVLGREIGADVLAIATQVPCVFENYGKPNQRALRELTAEEARARLARGEYPAGSMAPKIEAACDFVETGIAAEGATGGGGREAIITDVASLESALQGKAGTIIRR
ncbi:MAG: carbamate kinase [Candidatus Norongarragalinales archaeon]